MVTELRTKPKLMLTKVQEKEENLIYNLSRHPKFSCANLPQ